MTKLKALVVRAMVKHNVPLSKVGRVLKDIKFPNTARLLGSSQKVEKGEKKGILTTVMYLAPAHASVPYGGRNLCPSATPGCIAACLGHSSGRLAFSSSQNAQLWKTLYWVHCPEAFMAQLNTEIGAHVARAARKGLTPAIRLNGTSDIAWERTHLIRAWPDVQFYDYTKIATRALLWAAGELPKNYHVTYSLAETARNQTGARDVAAAGGNVAAVFRTRDVAAFPKSFLGLPVVNGDESDTRFDDPRGCCVGLTCKGPLALRDTTGFVQEV